MTTFKPIFAILPAIIFLTVSCVQNKKDIIVMTYNVGVFEKSGSNSMEDIAGIIRKSGAGYVSLNELDSCNIRHGVFQLQELADAAGDWNCHFAKAFDFAGGGYGNGIITKDEIIDSYSVQLPQSDGEEPRSMAVVETGLCVFASVHLDHIGKEARCRQAEAINSWFTEKYSNYPKPVILCGDMNATPESDAIKILSEEWELLSGTAPTHPSDAPEVCIDYIFALKSARKIQKHEIINIENDCPKVLSEASDHRPIIIRICLKFS